MHRIVDGIQVELTPAEEAEVIAERAAARAELDAQEAAKAAKLALCATRLADVPADADLGQLRAIVQCLIEEMRGD